MRLAAITTYPPSTRAASDFGYHATCRFLESPEVDEIVVLADRAEGPAIPARPELVVDRCWTYNSVLNPFVLMSVIRHRRPDIVWVNLQYTLFGSKPLPILAGLLTPALVRLAGYPVVLLLHNYLGSVDVKQLGLRTPIWIRIGMRLADKIAMSSLRHADRVFTMVPEYAEDLALSHRFRDVAYVEQDLYRVEPFQAPDPNGLQVLTMGYFGTYKRLEVLLAAFAMVRSWLPQAKLRIVGRSHDQAPEYLSKLRYILGENAEGVEFLGYVPEANLPLLFREANVVVATPSVDTGSSAVLRYAAVHGRAMVLPDAARHRDARRDGWGVSLYLPDNARDLAQVLAELLTDHKKQVLLGATNHRRMAQCSDQLVTGHLTAFRQLAAGWGGSRRSYRSRILDSSVDCRTGWRRA